MGAVPARRGRKGGPYAVSARAFAGGCRERMPPGRFSVGVAVLVPKLFGLSVSSRARRRATDHDVFVSRDADALSRVLGRPALGAGRPCGGRRQDAANALHVLSAFAGDMGAGIGALAGDPDTNEITAALLKGLPRRPCHGRFLLRAHSWPIREADYLFTVKDNQVPLRHDIATAFGDASPSDGPPCVRQNEEIAGRCGREHPCPRSMLLTHPISWRCM